MGGEAGGEFADLEAKGFDEVDQSGDVGGFPAEAEQDEAEADAEHLRGEEKALFEEEAGEVSAVSGRIEGQDSQFPVKLVEVHGEVAEVGAEDMDAAEAELPGDFRAVAGLAGEELEIGLIEEARHGAKADGITGGGEGGGAHRTAQCREEDGKTSGQQKYCEDRGKEHRILDHGTPL